MMHAQTVETRPSFSLCAYIAHEKGPGYEARVELASFPVSLVESLAPADRGHAHFTT